MIVVPGSRPTAAEWGFGPLFNAIKDAVIVADASSGRIMLWNRGAAEMLGYSTEEAAALRLEELVPSNFREAHRRGLASFALHGTGVLIESDAPVEVPVIRKDGLEILMQLTLSRIHSPADPDGAYVMGMMRDVTELRESEQVAKLILDSSAQAMFALDRFGRCTMANPAAAALLRRQPEELEGENMHALMHHSRPDGSPYPVEECRIFQTFTAGRSTHVDDEVFWRADGTSFPAEYQSKPIARAGTLLGAVVTFADITARKRAEAEALSRELQLRHRAQTDVLTAVGNRRYANEVLDALQPGDAVLMIDIDEFKSVNDTHGHSAGDQVLVSLAAHLKGQLRQGDSLARFGGEEFVVVLRGAGPEAQSTAERMRVTWVPPIDGVTFTTGLALHMTGLTGAETLRRADEAMYQGKRAGRNQVVRDGPTSTHEDPPPSP